MTRILIALCAIMLVLAIYAFGKYTVLSKEKRPRYLCAHNLCTDSTDQAPRGVCAPGKSCMN